MSLSLLSDQRHEETILMQVALHDSRLQYTALDNAPTRIEDKYLSLSPK